MWGGGGGERRKKEGGRDREYGGEGIAIEVDVTKQVHIHAIPEKLSRERGGRERG